MQQILILSLIILNHALCLNVEESGRKNNHSSRVPQPPVILSASLHNKEGSDNHALERKFE